MGNSVSVGAVNGRTRLLQLDELVLDHEGRYVGLLTTLAAAKRMHEVYTDRQGNVVRVLREDGT